MVGGIGFFHHGNHGDADNPAGYSSNDGNGLYNQINAARNGAHMLKDFNNANGFTTNSGNSPGSIPPAINEHYYTIGEGNSLYHFKTDEYYSSNVLSWSATFGNRDTWKVGSEILNGGSFSISSGDHIMIHVKRNSIDYYKNGSVVHTQNHTPTSSPPALVGGVTDFVRKLIIGDSNNTGSFAIKRFNWHGNDKTTNEVSVIYLDRDSQPEP